MEGTYLLAMLCPGYRGVTLIRAFVRNLRTWSVMLREKARAEVPRGRQYRCAERGADCSVVAMRRGNSRGAKGAGHRVGVDMGQLATGGTRWSRRKAPAFHGWHEPCDRRRSSTDLREARGEIPRAYSATVGYSGLCKSQSQASSLGFPSSLKCM